MSISRGKAQNSSRNWSQMMYPRTMILARDFSSSTTPRIENIFLMPSMGLRRLNLGAALFMVKSPRVWARVAMTDTAPQTRSRGMAATAKTPQP